MAFSKTDRLCDYIAKVGVARSDKLAQACQIPVANIVPSLAVPVGAGYLTVCNVTRPGGGRGVNEYRLSSAGQGMSWADYKLLRRGPRAGLVKVPGTPPGAHPRAEGHDRPPASSIARHSSPQPTPPAQVAAPADQPQVSVKNGGSAEPADVIPAGDHAVAKTRGAGALAPGPRDAKRQRPAAPSRKDDGRDISFCLWEDGVLCIHMEGTVIELPQEATLRLARFIGQAEAA